MIDVCNRCIVFPLLYIRGWIKQKLIFIKILFLNWQIDIQNVSVSLISFGFLIWHEWQAYDRIENFQSSSLWIDLRKQLIDAQLKETTNRLWRLKIDKRYAFITGIIAAQYLIIWTPYSFIVILKFTGKTTFIEHYPSLPTLFAKISLILNPIILIYTSKMTHL